METVEINQDMTCEYLGCALEPCGRDATRVRHVYVIWVTAPILTALRALRTHPSLAACPECGRPWSLERPGGAIDNVSATTGHEFVRKVSDSCPACGAILHWDCTPAADRDRLNWPYLYLREPSLMEARAAWLRPLPVGRVPRLGPPA